MLTIKSTKIVYFDIDNTLATWKGFEYYPHSGYVRLLKQFKIRGHTTVVWSAGGAEWAEIVINKFGLSEYVDLIISKPDWYADDLRSEEFLPEINRIFLPEQVLESKEGEK